MKPLYFGLGVLSLICTAQAEMFLHPSKDNFSEEIALGAPILTFKAAVDSEVKAGHFYRIESVKRPSWNLYMQGNAQGSVHGVSGEGYGDQTYWYFTEHP